MNRFNIWVTKHSLKFVIVNVIMVVLMGFIPTAHLGNMILHSALSIHFFIMYILKDRIIKLLEDNNENS